MATDETDKTDDENDEIELSTVDTRFRVLPSGVLAFRLPNSKAGKPIWLDVVRRLKLCKHGHSMHEMHHWRCVARPRAKPAWVDCQCGTKGLFTDTKAKPSLPDGVLVPSYASVLWRDGTPKLLQPMNVLAVRVPGKPKEREVWIDRAGTARCEHGFTESGITRALLAERNHARAPAAQGALRLAPPAVVAAAGSRRACRRTAGVAARRAVGGVEGGGQCLAALE